MRFEGASSPLKNFSTLARTTLLPLVAPAMNNSRRRLQYEILGLLWVAANLAASPRLEADDALQERFQNEAIKAWRQLAGDLAGATIGFEQVMKSKITSPAEEDYGKTFEVRRQIYVAVRPDAAKVRTVEYDERGAWAGERVVAKNDKYSFVLQKLEENGDFVLKQCSYSSEAMQDAEWSLALSGLIDLHSCHGIESDVRSLEEIFASPTTEVLSVESGASSGGADVINVTFTYRPEGLAAQQDPSTRESTISLDPITWRVVESKTKRQLEESSQAIEYAEGAGAAASQPKHITRRSEYPAATVQYTLDFHQFERVAPPTDEFYLSHYGLPECLRLEARTGFSTARLILLGGTLMAIGFLLSAIFRRRQNAGGAGS